MECQLAEGWRAGGGVAASAGWACVASAPGEGLSWGGRVEGEASSRDVWVEE